MSYFLLLTAMDAFREGNRHGALDLDYDVFVDVVQRPRAASSYGTSTLRHA